MISSHSIEILVMRGEASILSVCVIEVDLMKMLRFNCIKHFLFSETMLPISIIIECDVNLINVNCFTDATSILQLHVLIKWSHSSVPVIHGVVLEDFIVLPAFHHSLTQDDNPKVGRAIRTFVCSRRVEHPEK